jgi:hypothetical protein
MKQEKQTSIKCSSPFRSSLSKAWSYLVPFSEWFSFIRKRQARINQKKSSSLSQIKSQLTRKTNLQTQILRVMMSPMMMTPWIHSLQNLWIPNQFPSMISNKQLLRLRFSPASVPSTSLALTPRLTPTTRRASTCFKKSSKKTPTSSRWLVSSSTPMFRNSVAEKL